MPRGLNVYALPRVVAPEELADGTVVVVDVLRSASTIVHALAAGADEVIPCLDAEEARRVAASFPPGTAVLGGECGGRPIEGFDLGNSPEEYTTQTVGGRVLVFTSTNGTRALAHCQRARRVLLGAFVNAAAVCRHVLDQQQIHVLCAGTDGQISRDDVLLAGLLVHRLQSLAGSAYQLNAQAVTAQENWSASFAVPQATGAEPLDPELLAKQLRRTEAGRHLVALGQEDDILACSRLDQFDLVPAMDPSTGRIRAAAPQDP